MPDIRTEHRDGYVDIANHVEQKVWIKQPESSSFVPSSAPDCYSIAVKEVYDLFETLAYWDGESVVTYYTVENGNRMHIIDIVLNQDLPDELFYPD